MKLQRKIVAGIVAVALGMAPLNAPEAAAVIETNIAAPTDTENPYAPLIEVELNPNEDQKLFLKPNPNFDPSDLTIFETSEGLMTKYAIIDTVQAKTGDLWLTVPKDAKVGEHYLKMRPKDGSDKVGNWTVKLIVKEPSGNQPPAEPPVDNQPPAEPPVDNQPPADSENPKVEMEDLSARPGGRVSWNLSIDARITDIKVANEAELGEWKVTEATPAPTGARISIDIPATAQPGDSKTVEFILKFENGETQNVTATAIASDAQEIVDEGNGSSDGSSSDGSSAEGETGSSEDFDKKKLWWLLLIPAGGLLAWGASKVVGGGEGSSAPGLPGVPGQPQPEAPKDEPKDAPKDEPKESDSEAEVTQEGAPVSKDAPRQNIKSVPSGATALEAGIATYI